MKKSKYNNTRVIITEDGTIFEIEQLKEHNITDITGTKFDSKMEAQYYLYLKQLLKIGKVSEINLQPSFILQDKPKIVYKADFDVTYSDGTRNIIDVKGMQTQAFRLKVRLFKAQYPDQQLVLAKKQGRLWEMKMA